MCFTDRKKTQLKTDREGKQNSDGVAEHVTCVQRTIWCIEIEYQFI